MPQDPSPPTRLSRLLGRPAAPGVAGADAADAGARGPGEAVARRVSPHLRHMWLALLREEWSSLAVVPSDRDVPLTPVVDALLELTQVHNVRLYDASGYSTSDASKLGARLAAPRPGDPRAVVVVASLLDSLSGISLVSVASRSLLVVRQRATPLESVGSTLSIVGRERVIGCAVLA